MLRTTLSVGLIEEPPVQFVVSVWIASQRRPPQRWGDANAPRQPGHEVLIF